MNILSSIIKNKSIYSLYVLISLSLFISSAYAGSPSVHDSLSKATNKESSNAYAFNKCRAMQAKPFDENSNKKRAIIIGDSQGCDFLNSAIENGYLRDYQIQFHFIPYPCQTVPGEYISNYIAPKHRAFCTKTNRIDSFEKIKKQLKGVSLVVFASLWKPQVAEKLPQIINYLELGKQQRLVVIGNKFFGKLSIHNYFHLTNKELRSLRNNVGTQSLEINSILKRKSSGKAIFVDPHQLVCGDNSTSCPIFTNNTRLISYDGRHLTKDGARYIGRILFQHSALGHI